MRLFQFGHQVLSGIERNIKKGYINSKFELYKKKMDTHHPFKTFPMNIVGDTSANPHEFFSHYDSYSFWLAKKIKEMNGNSQNILDVGNLKVTNALLSLSNTVTSLTLMDCEDRISNVNYIIQDIAKPLQLADSSFDIFTSLASLHLVGLGRYGDEINPNTLINFIRELDRVMKKNSDLIFSISYGKNCLAFNEGWKFDIEILKKLFDKWELVDWLIDNHSSHTVKPYTERFTKDLSLDGWVEGEYRVIFLHFKR